METHDLKNIKLLFFREPARLCDERHFVGISTSLQLGVYMGKKMPILLKAITAFTLL